MKIEQSGLHKLSTREKKMERKHLEEFAIYINQLSSEIYDISALRKINPNDETSVEDSPDKYYFPGISSKNDSVVMISNSKHPDFLDRSVKRTLTIREKLSEKNRDVVLAPLKYGRFQEMSYVIWPEQKPISDNKFIRAYEKKMIQGRVFEWLRELAKDSIVKDLDESTLSNHIRAPLECLIKNPRHSKIVKQNAAIALEKLDNKIWKPVTIFQHSDFWLENILIEKHKSRPVSQKYGFCVIDWGGAFTNGAPVFDFIRFCRSVNVKKNRAKKELLKYILEIELPPEDMTYSLLVALGRIGLQLESFPEDRYIEMSETSMCYLQELIY